MATKTKKHKSAGPRRHYSAGSRRHRSNPAPRHHRRKNPGGSAVSGIVKTSVAVIGGAVGSKLGAQLVLGSSNTGVFGYLGNAVAGGILAWAAKAFKLGRDVSQGIIIGTAVQIILRVIGDYTQFGSYLSLSGMGDYMAANWVQPQRLTDALNGAMVEIPNGWGGSMMLPAPATAGASMTGLYDGSSPYGGSLY